MRPGYNRTLVSGEALSSSTGVATSPAINLAFAKGNFSIQTEVTGTLPNYDITYTESNDEQTYYTPSQGDLGVVISSATGSCLISFAPRCAKSIKFRFANNNATSNLTITKSTLYFDEK